MSSVEYASRRSACLPASTDAIRQWARSGLMALTGTADGPPLLPTRDYIGRISAVLAEIDRLTGMAGKRMSLNPSLLTERAAILGLSRRGAISPGGTCRLVRARDGWVAVNLARDEDRDLVPALIGRPIDADLWEALRQSASQNMGAALAARGQNLGLPVARVGSQASRRATSPRLPFRLLRPTASSYSPKSNLARRRLLVVDFSSLWAGPLCGHLFASMGARVIKAESIRRPDGVRLGPSDFFDRLHTGQESLALDFADVQDRARLRALIERADVIIEGSRPRAFDQMGFSPESIFAINPRLTWVSITAYGRYGRLRNRVGFGDDVAAAAGLLEIDKAGNPSFIGDALADPITGLAATVGALTSIDRGGGYLVDAAMSRCAAFVAAAEPLPRSSAKVVRDKDGWKVIGFGLSEPVVESWARIVTGQAPSLGAHNAEILAELL